MEMFVVARERQWQNHFVSHIGSSFLSSIERARDIHLSSASGD